MTDSGTTLQTLYAEWCMCPVCGESLKHPRLLPCCHAVCGVCLDSLLQQHEANTEDSCFPCPRCQRSIPVPTTDIEPKSRWFKPDTFTSKLSEVIDAYKVGKTCNICSRRNIAEGATSWCMDCFDAVCDNCTKIHLCGKTTCDHMIVSLDELRHLSLENIMKRSTPQTCETHPDEVIKLYCMDCRTPVCVQCLTLHHRKCDNCVSLSEAMTSQEEEVMEVMMRGRNYSNDLQVNGVGAGEADSPYETGAEVLEKSVLKAEAAIHSLAEDLKARIDESVRQILDRLHSVGSQLHDKVGDFRQAPGTREDDVRSLSSCTERMEALLKYGSDVEVLDMYHSMRDTLARLEGLNSSRSSESTEATTDDEVRLKVNFDVDEIVQQFCRNFTTLGDIRVEDCVIDEGLSSWGVTVSGRDTIVVVDCRNKRVQKFASTGDLIDHIQISEEPRDVTSCGENSDDVAIPIMKKQIFIVGVGASKNMSLKRKIKTNKQYESIASAPDGHAFLVGCLEDNSVDIISAQGGDVIKSFSNNSYNPGQPSFCTPRYVTWAHPDNLVISDVAHSTITCLRQDGSLNFTYSPKGAHELKKGQGVCSDKVGNLFMADYTNCRVHLVSQDGTFQRFVLGRDSGLRRPVALAMTPTNKLVLVQSDGMVKVFSYESMKVKLKVSCWCPRCIANKGEGHENHGGAAEDDTASSVGGGSYSSGGSGGYRSYGVTRGQGVKYTGMGEFMRTQSNGGASLPSTPPPTTPSPATPTTPYSNGRFNFGAKATVEIMNPSGGPNGRARILSVPSTPSTPSTPKSPKSPFMIRP